ncbi:MAG: hypothetical protein Q4B67_03185 [Eubacteriales bacterium]|nr:hypothetical protein [Eubacteriales bacterium]
MKKLLAVLIVMLMVLSLAACGGKESKAEKTEDKKQTETTAAKTEKTETKTEAEILITEEETEEEKGDEKAAPYDGPIAMDITLPENFFIIMGWDGEWTKMGNDCMWSDGGWEYKFYRYVADNDYDVYVFDPEKMEFNKDGKATFDDIYGYFRMTLGTQHRTGEEDECEGLPTVRYYDEKSGVFEEVWEETGMVLRRGVVGEGPSAWIGHQTLEPIQFPQKEALEKALNQ